MLVMDRATGAFEDDLFTNLRKAFAPRRSAGPQRQPRDSRAPLCAQNAATRARETHRPHRSDAHRAGRRKPVARAGAARAAKSPSASGWYFPRPRARSCSKRRCSSAASSAIACFEFAPGRRFLCRSRSHRPHPSPSLYSPRRCGRGSRSLPDGFRRRSVARWPRPRPVCTSRRRCSTRSTEQAALRLRASRFT